MEIQRIAGACSVQRRTDSSSAAGIRSRHDLADRAGAQRRRRDRVDVRLRSQLVEQSRGRAGLRRPQRHDQQDREIPDPACRGSSARGPRIRRPSEGRRPRSTAALGWRGSSRASRSRALRRNAASGLAGPGAPGQPAAITHSAAAAAPASSSPRSAGRCDREQRLEQLADRAKGELALELGAAGAQDVQSLRGGVGCLRQRSARSSRNPPRLRSSRARPAR